ncbi:hypothetical protein DPMN_013028 [Dreissena polymorpha]|uniref:Uncharacterized protein n=1 Tax=Dreissena polymorpha TaxID=45954 RepID=A0A9D4N6W9_DREPO|nr:hypothetical protein DPMN_013028 [Dreissena polymorpha]
MAFQSWVGVFWSATPKLGTAELGRSTIDGASDWRSPTLGDAHIAMASFEDHASTGVPPQVEATRPIGRFSCW